VIAIQNAVSWSQRGVATATSQFFRTIGGSIGVAILGAMLSNQWRAYAADRGVTADFSRASDVLDPTKRGDFAPALLAAIEGALADALHNIFLVVAGLAVVMFLVVLFFPKGRADELAADSASEQPAQEPAAVEVM
ncbi:MAG TPA: MFS transporter, partial [Dehalococcoidia bacterium]|nr:MFS transporter [Dehalococcoidia bacterium]